jgi:hypothetical protein
VGLPGKAILYLSQKLNFELAWLMLGCWQPQGIAPTDEYTNLMEGDGSMKTNLQCVCTTNLCRNSAGYGLAMSFGMVMKVAGERIRGCDSPTLFFVQGRSVPISSGSPPTS